MFKCSACILIISSCTIQIAKVQDTTASKFTLDGYVSFMESAMDMNLDGKKLLWESLLHNRLNMHYYPSGQWSFSLQIRNRLMVGDRFRLETGEVHKQSLESDMGVTDLSWNALSGRSYVLNSAVDRFWVKYASGRLEITAGRQRINWGQTNVWNPNDWFNNYSFFEVDYVERPGSDALRIQYFARALSGIEAAAKLDSAGDLTVAGLYKTNVRHYDMQFLSGILSSEDLALGFGWAGNLGQIGFKGEMTYLHPLKHMKDTSGLFFLSVSFDYTFSSSLMIQAEGYYNQLSRGGGNRNINEFYSRPLSVKDLSFTETNLFGQVSYPFTPLFTGSLAVLYFPEVSGYFLGPAFTFSLGNNLDLSLFIQHFSGKFHRTNNDPERQNFTMGFARIKFSF